MNAPAAYLKRMEERLPDFAAYAACLSLPPYKGIRVNTLKISAEEFAGISPFSLSPVPWEVSGYYIAEEKPGRSAYHDAGLFYVQEPSAMCAAPLLDVRPGERVLDLCAAPGGKGTQLAQAMRGQGILVLNEKIPARAKILLQNVERMGIVNAVVTCADPETIAERFEGYFDKVLVDAPCSGEGMLRKEEEAAANWSPENVAMCAARQKKLLDSAARTVRAGGLLVYSTCTFAEEEDEENAAGFLARHPEFTLMEQKKIYPHREKGEGHFAALFVREGESRCRLRPGKERAERQALSAFSAFADAFLKERPAGRAISFGESLCAVPEDLFSLDGLRVLRAGLALGSVRGGRFEPAHALALAAPGYFREKADYTQEEISRYLHGEEMPCMLRGWCAVSVDGFPVGLGKAVGGVLKNHYPKGLRR